jgi:protein O-mannosyl-transferase
MHPEQNSIAALNAQPLRVVALIFCSVLVAYANSFAGVFQFDDFNVIVNNANVHSWSAWWQDAPRGIRPLLKFTYTLDWTLGRGELPYHFTNVLIHLCNTVLVWLLSRHFMAHHPALKDQSVLPLLVTLLFAVHPAHTEAVTYICGRSSALMTLFYLAGMLMYIHGKAQNSQFFLHLLTPLCMLLALGVKETAVTFPAALLLWEIYNGGKLKSALRYQWSSWVLLLLSAIFFVLHDGYLAQMKISAGFNSLQENLAMQPLALAYLLRQWLFPVWLNIDPDLQVAHGFAGLLPQTGILIFCIYLIIFSFNKRPWLSFGLVWAILHLLPLYLFLPRIDVANDRQLYLVSWPLVLAVVAELSLLMSAKIFRLAIALLMLVLLGLTVMRNQQYQSEISLWEATARYSPNKARVQNNLGYAYMLAGRAEEARSAFATALQHDPKYYQARYNLFRLDVQEAAVGVR